ncbi:hypothetical protein CF319_g4116 [Tilletia indica]|nr:hypothetical protein CF319_g4116 [Tilletia indica]
MARSNKNKYQGHGTDFGGQGIGRYGGFSSDAYYSGQADGAGSDSGKRRRKWMRRSSFDECDDGDYNAGEVVDLFSFDDDDEPGTAPALSAPSPQGRARLLARTSLATTLTTGAQILSYCPRFSILADVVSHRWLLRSTTTKSSLTATSMLASSTSSSAVTTTSSTTSLASSNSTSKSFTSTTTSTSVFTTGSSSTSTTSNPINLDHILVERN